MRLTITLLLSVAAAPLLAETPLPRPISDADYAPINMEEAKLGQLLFYDPILSGNRNISCATCHHPKFFTGDGVSLGLGEGGIGLGPDRKPDPNNMPEQRIPRHATALFNLGAKEFTVLFHDGRIEQDPTQPGGMRTPLDADMTAGFASVLSAQTMFPVLSGDEMAGHFSENDVSKAVRSGRITGDGGAWDIISKRVDDNDEYRSLFNAVYLETKVGRPIAFTDISNSIAVFIEHEWRSDTSAFDAYLRGEAELDQAATEGLQLFYGNAACASCHSGPYQTDHGFHATGQPQLGPGKAASFEDHARDTGRMRVTGRVEDAYAFRTPSLRNVTKTAPYGHTGAYTDLAAFLHAHADPVTALSEYDRRNATLPLLETDDWRIMDDPEELAAIRLASKTFTDPLTDNEVAQLIAFLKTLEDLAALNGRLGIPDAVPSGLKIDR